MRLSRYLVLLILGVLVLPSTSRANHTRFVAPQHIAPQGEPHVLIDDFESGLPSAVDSDGNGIGFNTWHDPSSSISLTTTTVITDPVPVITGTNNVLQFNANVVSWGGFTHALSDAGLTAWVPQDWSAYAGIRMWIYGQNTGTTMFVDILDNRNPGSTTDDAERWSASFADDWSGWQLRELPFSTFTRKEIGNGAPNDGFTLTSIHGWALGTLNTAGPKTWYVDHVEVYGVAPPQPLTVRFTTSGTAVDEGETGAVNVQLSKPYTVTVTVDYVMSEGTARFGRDVEPISGTLTFAPNVTQQTIPITTIGDLKYEGTETVLLNLSNPSEAELGVIAQHIVSIVDDERFDPYLINDFEGPLSMITTTGALTIESREIAQADPEALPGQGAYEQVLEVESTAAGSLTEHLPGPQDWSDSTSVSFWFYGSGSGQSHTFELLDNRADTTGNGDWELVWSDEFDDPAGTLPDPTIWTHEIGDGSINGIPGWGNDELQYYTNDPANVSHDGQGHLNIVAREHTGDLTCYYGPCEYTSARLISKDKAEFQYGRIEARIKVSEGPGLWPAFWMLGNDINEVNWPQSGEIDIMEYVGREPYEVFGTIHGPGYSGGNSYGDFYTFAEPVATEFHTFTIDWQPESIIWYVDGIQYHTAQPSDVAPNEWVYEHPFFLLLNMAIGGNFGGPVGENVTFPQTMTVDYVRVYQNIDSSERFEATFIDQQAGWQQITLPYSAFVRSSEQPIDAPNDGLTLTQVWGYGINVSQPSNFLLDQVRRIPDCQSTLSVTSNLNNGTGSLREALEQLCAGGTITFDAALAEQTIDLTEPLTISNDVSIDGSNAPGLAISGQGTQRVLIIDPATQATVHALEITEGYGWDLAGAILNNGELTLDAVTVSNSIATAEANDYWKGGGAIYNGEGATLRLYNSAVVSNTTAAIDGGGIYSFFDSTTIISNSAIISNTAGNVGGGLRSLGNVHISNSTLSGNHSTAWHGGAIFHTDAQLDISSSTIANNSAAEGVTGGLLVATFGANSPLANVQNTVIANNTGPQCAIEDQGAGTAGISSLDHNFSSDASCPFAEANDQTASDALLGELVVDIATWVHLPQTSSPLIDAGANCPAFDQRGLARPQGPQCDIGAVEVLATSEPVWNIFLPIVRR